MPLHSCSTFAPLMISYDFIYSTYDFIYSTMLTHAYLYYSVEYHVFMYIRRADCP